MFPTDPYIPPEVIAAMRAAGVMFTPPAKPRDPVSDASARDGVIRQWMPAYPNEEPPF
jgi:hypothetical protein